MNRAPWWVWASLAGCVVACLASLYFRHSVEAGNRAVGVMMEMDDVEALAASSGRPLAEILADLKGHGLVGVSLPEETVADLLADGRLAAGPTGDTLAGQDAQRVLAPISWYTKVERSPDPSLLLLDVPVKSVLRLPVGLNPRQAEAAREAGLLLIARHSSFPGMREEQVRETLRQSHALGATAYLIGGTQAIGNRDLIEATAEELGALGMHYLSPEFVVLGGDSFLRRELAPQTIRLHSIQQIEAEQSSQSEVEERMAKAFRERDCRWLLVRSGTAASPDPMHRANESLFSLRKAIVRAGGAVKPPRPFDEPPVPRWLVGLIGLLAAPTVAWTVARALQGRSGTLLGVLAGGLMLLSFTEGQKGYATLVAATALPVFGYIVVAGGDRRRPTADFATMTALSLVGGLCVGGMLVGTDYMLRVDAFTGVKFAVFVPVLVVGAVCLSQTGGLRKAWATPVAWGAAVVAIAGLVALYLLAVRSGNDNPAAVSSIELRLRSLLDTLVYVRPRSKEVFFGHPALVLGLCLAAYRPNLRGWASLLLVAGMVGQTSVVNTMCHLHTPVALSLARIGIGAVAGGIIGLVLWLVVRWWAPVEETMNQYG